MEPLHIVTSITVLLSIGVVLSIVSSRLRIPDLLLLILVGSFLAYSPWNVQVSSTFQNALAIIALAFIIFEGTVQIKFRELNTFTLKAAKLVFFGTLFVLFGFGAAVHFLGGYSWMASFLIAAFVSGTSPAVILSLLKSSKNHVVEVLKFESLLNTPLTLLIPVFILGLGGAEGTLAAEFGRQSVDFVQSIVTGIGTGVVIGMLLVKFIRMSNLSQLHTSLSIMLASLLTYVLSERLQGNGVIAVTSLGLFFGNVYLGHIIKKGVELTKFGSILTHAMYLLVFLLLGTTLKYPRNSTEFLISVILFVIYLGIRFVAVWLSLHKEFTRKEMLFAALTAPKGIATATVVFAVVLTGLAPTSTLVAKDLFAILNISMLLIFYSILLSTVTARASQIFIEEEIKTKVK